MRILFVLPSLGYGGAATQAALLSQAFGECCDVHVCSLIGSGPWAAALANLGVMVHSLAWKHALDPRPLFHLRRVVASLHPDCIHAWRLPAVRAVAWAGRKFLPRCVVSQVLPMDRGQPRLGRWDRWLLRRVAKVVASDSWEAAALERLGVASAKISVIPPGVDIPATAVAPTSEAGRRIVCVGNLESHKGFREALRAADYLTYSFADLHLEIIGAGSALPGLQRFRSAAYYADHLHLVGPRADAALRMAQADVCWVPSLTATGRHVALEAMAMGKPVIASDLPPFREIIVDGVSGLLVPVGDKLTLARRSRQLLLDEALRRRLGEAARATVHERFSATRFIDSCRALYEAEFAGVFSPPPTRVRFSIASAEPSRNNALKPRQALATTGRPVS